MDFLEGKFMSEAEQNFRGQKAKISKVAMVSMIPGFLGICFVLFYPHKFEVRAVILGLSGILLALFALGIIYGSKEDLSGKKYVICGIFLGLISTVIASVISINTMIDRNAGHNRILCGSMLKGIGTAIFVLSHDYDGEFPEADKWCDLLVEKADFPEEYLKCPADKKDVRCSYAMNPNCRPDSAGGVVLLFEAKGGWNQSGGAELLNLENHGGEGCNVLFNDGSARFVRAEDIGKLKWKDEE